MPQNVTVFQFVNKIPRLVWDIKIHHRVHTNPPLVPIQ